MEKDLCHSILYQDSGFNWKYYLEYKVSSGKWAWRFILSP